MKIGRILSCTAYLKDTGEVLFSVDYSNQCPLFNFCNCKTAACRFALPDESCYWYRYFKDLIKKRENGEEI